MKTTIEISDDPAGKARVPAASENISFHSLIERGLRLALRASRDQDRFKLRDASVGGRGLQAEFRDAEWSRFREAAYEGRGG